MKRDEIVKKLLQFGYKQNTIDKLLQGKIKPTMDKAIKLNDDYDIPFSAWRDIKSYIENDTKQSDDKSTDKSNEEVA